MPKRPSPRPRQKGPPSGTGGPAYAAIDLGTNNCRMLVARDGGTNLDVIDSFSRIVRLGEGIHAGSQLDEAAIGRTVEALKICAGKIRKNNVVRTRAIATEACRQAENCATFIGRIRNETGLELEVISAEEEAGLTLAGCLPLLDTDARHVLLFDIGGGSTEVVWVEIPPEGIGPDAHPRVVGFLSLPIGVVSVSERFGPGGPHSDDHCETIRAEVDAALSSFDEAHGISKTVSQGAVQMIGTSGTVTSLGGMHLGLERYDRSKVDGLVMNFDAIADVSRKLKTMSLQDRTNHPCIGRGRADLTVPGCAILAAILGRWPVGHLMAADRGIREGILTSMMAEASAAGLTR